IHGDFHPFNVVFGEGGRCTLLDASRGCAGDPANDVTCMVINYPFFCVDRPDLWRTSFRHLWFTFWETYLSAARDEELCEVAALYLAWRVLVLCCPAWYLNLSANSRDRLLSLVEDVLEASRFDLDLVEKIWA